MKRFNIVEMTEEYAKQIMGWTYEEPYATYNLESNDETLSELLNGSYVAVLKENELIGFYCSGFSAIVPPGMKHHVYDDEGYIDLGLGMKPNCCGQGLGYEFIQNELDYMKQKYNTNKFRLSVYNFNVRAIKVYEKLGFVSKYQFKLNENNSNYFIVMLLN